MLLYFGSLFSQGESLIISGDMVETLNIDSMYVTVKLDSCQGCTRGRVNFTGVSELYLIDQQKMDSLFIVVISDNSSLRPQFPIVSETNNCLIDNDCGLRIMYWHLGKLRKEKFLRDILQFKHN